MTLPIQGIGIAMLDAEEFYRRFDQIVPGVAASGGVALFGDADIYFERLSMAGLEEMHRYSTGPRLYEFLEFEPFRTIEDTRAYLTKLQNRMGSDPLNRTAMYWFVRRKSDRRLVGTAALVEFIYARRSIEWGYGVDPELWGSGYILQMQEMLKHYVFEVLELNRLSGMTMLENQRTISSVLSAGMKHEGVRRQVYCKDGVFHDAWQYAMVREDYFEKPGKSAPARARHTVTDVIELVGSILTEEVIGPDSTMVNVPTWDSLHHMEIIIEIAERMGVTLSPTETMRATSVAAIAKIVASPR